MFIFLYGKDSYRSRLHLEKIKNKFSQERDPHGMNVVVVNAFEENSVFIKEQVLASPFLAEKRMVVLRKIFEAEKDFQNWMQEKHGDLSGRDDLICVVWSEKDSVKKSELFNLLSAEKFAQKFELPKGKKLENWILGLVQEFGGEINSVALAKLVNSFEDDLWQLANVIHQLVMYCDKRAITDKDVDLFVKEKVDDAIFALMDALTQKNKARALQLLHQQWNFGSEPGQVFGMIVRQFKILTDLYSYRLANPNSTEKQIANSIGLHPFVVKKTLPMLRSYNLKNIAQIQHILLEIDRKIKTGAGQMTELLDWLVVAV